MRSNVRHVLSVIVLASIAVAILGCSHDTLGSGTQGLTLFFTPSPAGAGRFDTATFDITQIKVLPDDPDTAAIYGTQSLLFRFTSYTANLVRSDADFFAEIALPQGPYRVKSLTVKPLSLVDNVVSPNPECREGVEIFNRSVVPGIPATFEFADPASLNFTVRPGQTTLALRVNVPDLIKGYESSFTCQFLPCAGCPVDPAPSLTAFNEANFRAALLANLTFE